MIDVYDPGFVSSFLIILINHLSLAKSPTSRNFDIDSRNMHCKEQVYIVIESMDEKGTRTGGGERGKGEGGRGRKSFPSFR